MSEAAKAATVADALARVMGHIQRVPKNGHNSFHNYDYTTEADLLEHVRPLMAAEGLSIIPSIDEHACEAVTCDGKQTFRTRVKMSFRFRCTGSGEELGPFTWYGEATDKGDKGLYKAITGAVKYFLFKTFLVSTGDDPEDEHPAKPDPRPAKKTEPADPRPAADPNPAPAPQGPPLHERIQRQYERLLQKLGSQGAAVNAMRTATGKQRSAEMTEADITKLEAI